MRNHLALQDRCIRRRGLLLAAGGFAVAFASGCASAPKPLVARLSIEAAPSLNPDLRGRPSPVAVKILELKTLTAFDRADFFSLFDRDRETLGAELVARDEVVLKPGDRITQERKLAPDVKFIGVLAGFRDLERSQWRLAIPVETVGSQPIVILVDASRVALKGK